MAVFVREKPQYRASVCQMNCCFASSANMLSGSMRRVLPRTESFFVLSIVAVIDKR